MELLSRQPHPTTPTSQQESVEGDEATLESHQGNVSSIASSQSTSVHDTSVSSVVNESSVTSVNEQSGTSVVNELPKMCAI